MRSSGGDARRPRAGHAVVDPGRYTPSFALPGCSTKWRSRRPRRFAAEVEQPRDTAVMIQAIGRAGRAHDRGSLQLMTRLLGLVDESAIRLEPEHAGGAGDARLADILVDSSPFRSAIRAGCALARVDPKFRHALGSSDVDWTVRVRSGASARCSGQASPPVTMADDADVRVVPQ